MDTRLLRKLRRKAKRQVKVLMIEDAYIVWVKIDGKYNMKFFHTIEEAIKERRRAIYNKVAVDVIVRRLNKAIRNGEKNICFAGRRGKMRKR